MRGARVYVDARPSLSYTTGADGAYALRLPIGEHDITVEAAGYRIGHATVTLTDAGASHDFDLIARAQHPAGRSGRLPGLVYGTPRAQLFPVRARRSGVLVRHAHRHRSNVPARPDPL